MSSTYQSLACRHFGSRLITKNVHADILDFGCIPQTQYCNFGSANPQNGIPKKKNHVLLDLTCQKASSFETFGIDNPVVLDLHIHRTELPKKIM